MKLEAIIIISNNQDTDGEPTLYGLLDSDQVGIGTTNLGHIHFQSMGIQRFQMILKLQVLYN